MSASSPMISVVSPVYGCAQCLPQLVEGIHSAMREIGCVAEIILVEDDSPDESWTYIQRLVDTYPEVVGVRLSRNFGQHAAILAGLEYVSGDWIVVLDCDLQDPPEEIPLLYKEAVSQGLDAVFAERVEREDSAFKRSTSWAFHRSLSWLTGVRHDGKSANFGIFRRPVIDAVLSMPERSKAFPLMVKWVGFDIGYVPVKHAPRAAGRSGYTLAKLLGLARTVILSYSDRPLRMVTTAGLACSLVAFAFALGTVFMFLRGDIQVAGFTSLMASLWLLGGLVMLSLGVVGLYVGQVYLNVQGRPASIVRDVVGGNDRQSQQASRQEPHVRRLVPGSSSSSEGPLGHPNAESPTAP